MVSPPNLFGDVKMSLQSDINGMRGLLLRARLPFKEGSTGNNTTHNLRRHMAKQEKLLDEMAAMLREMESKVTTPSRYNPHYLKPSRKIKVMPNVSKPSL